MATIFFPSPLKRHYQSTATVRGGFGEEGGVGARETLKLQNANQVCNRRSLSLLISLQITLVQCDTTITQKSNFFTKIFLGKIYLKVHRTTVTHTLDSTQKTKQKILSGSGQTGLLYRMRELTGWESRLSRQKERAGGSLHWSNWKSGRKLTHLPSTQRATSLKVNSLCHSWWGAKHWPLSHQRAGTACNISFVSLPGTDYY